MSLPKLRGYLYQIVEVFPIEEGNGIRELHTYDNLEDAKTVLTVLESVNHDFTTYAMMMRPVWEDYVPMSSVLKDMFGWDANGSPVLEVCDHNGATSSLSTSGKFTFNCPKCGLKYGS